MVGTEQGWSQQELRVKLVEKLVNTGIKDKLKSQLRSRVFAELATRSRISKISNENLLLTKAVDSLFIEYLQSRGLEFSLSVFVPESGIFDQILSETDVLHALRLDRPFSKYKDFHLKSAGPLVIRLFDSFSKASDPDKLDKEAQTNVDLDSLLKMDKNIGYENNAIEKAKLVNLEQRILAFQRDLENASKRELDRQLSKMRIEEKTRLNSELSQQKAEFEQKLLDLKQGQLESLESAQKRLELRERELEKQNLDLRQKLYEETNRMIFKETSLRNDAELNAKELRMEKELLQRRFDQVNEQLKELQNFKEKYIQKMEDSMAQYKIDLNKEYSNKSVNLEVEKTRLEGDRMILNEKSAMVEKMLSNIQAQEEERESFKIEIKDLNLRVEELTKEKDEALFEARELRLKMLTQENSNSLEFEISSLKKQLIEAEKTAERRQEEYQELLKSLITPKDNLADELAKARSLANKWQSECQQLVLKLEYEMNKNDDLCMNLEKETLRVKELERDLADTRLLLHQSQTALTAEFSNFSPYTRRDYPPIETQIPISDHFEELYSRIASERKSIPDPYLMDYRSTNQKIHSEQKTNIAKELPRATEIYNAHIESTKIENIRSESEDIVKLTNPPEIVAQIIPAEPQPVNIKSEELSNPKKELNETENQTPIVDQREKQLQSERFQTPIVDQREKQLQSERFQKLKEAEEAERRQREKAIQEREEIYARQLEQAKKIREEQLAKQREEMDPTLLKLQELEADPEMKAYIDQARAKQIDNKKSSSSSSFAPHLASGETTSSKIDESDLPSW